MRLTFLSLPLLSLASSQAVWNTGDGAKYAGGDDPNETITSAIVADGVVDLSTGVYYNDGSEKGVFQLCTKLKTVRLPESLRKIGFCAFNECKALVHVDIPSGVNEIGEGAFGGSSLETVTIPEGVLDLPRCMFYHCQSLKSVKLPTSLKTIGEHVFSNCSALATATIPEGIVDLPKYIFNECKSLKSVKLPFSLKTIGRYAFYKNSSLTTINFDALKGVTEIGDHAFSHSLSLTVFELPPLLEIIEKATFSGCKSLVKVDLSPSLKVIRAYAMSDCHNDLHIDLPETVSCHDNSPCYKEIKVRAELK